MEQKKLSEHGTFTDKQSKRLWEPRTNGHIQENKFKREILSSTQGTKKPMHKSMNEEMGFSSNMCKNKLGDSELTSRGNNPV